MLTSRKGFTLVEMLVVMTVFVVIIILAGDSFNTILTQMNKVSTSEESNIEGVVGLEMFRHDIQQSGYGLPDSFVSSSQISYREAGYAPANLYNDGTGSVDSGVPRALVAGNDLISQTNSDGTENYNILAGTDYVALKGATLGLNEASQKWTYMPFSSAVTGKQKPRLWQTNNLVANDRVIVIRKNYNSTSRASELVFNTSTPTIYWANFDATGFADSNFIPTLPEEMYLVYGIRTAASGTELGMPFNRSDYFVAKPSNAARFPAFCASNTGVLYKGVLNHTTTSPGGRLTYVPLLDCVADMQVVLGWDLDDGHGVEGQDGLIDTYSTPLDSSDVITSYTSNSPATDAEMRTRLFNAIKEPEKLRSSLKIVKVYLLVQSGRRDMNYQSPASFVVGDQRDGFSKTFNLSADMRNYRWKTYRIVVRPKNFAVNQ